MKKTNILYGFLFTAGLLATVIIVASLQSPPPGEKTAQAPGPAALSTDCVPPLLAGQTLVNGLGKDVRIPLFPGAKRFSFTDTTAVQYSAKAYDSDIKSFYDDRLAGLCWQIKEQQQNQVVYKNNGHELKISLLPGISGRTVIDYVVSTTEGVLGTVKIAQAACTSGQMYCNGGCVAQGSPCLAPTDASSCSGGTIWCPSSSGSGGWCQMPPCPSSNTSTTGAWPTDQATCTSRSYFWCNNACQMTACSTSTTSNSNCSGSYQQPGVSYTQCNNSVCPNGCTWDSSGCPNGCYTSSSTTNANTWPNDQASCASQGKYWCTSQSSSGWCQGGPCPVGDYAYSTGSSACSSGQYWCSSSNACIPNSSSCAPMFSGGSVGTTCPAGQYMCSGVCVNSGSACSQTTWPMDQGSCTSQNKFWCTGAYSGSTSGGWCQTTACSTNYSTTTCAAGQWMCNNACIPTSANCNGYYHNGTAVTPPSGTTCAGGYTWCASSQSCVNAVQPCQPSATQTQTTPPQKTQPATQPQQQPNTQNQPPQQNNQQPNNQPFNQGVSNGQFGAGQQGPSEADQKRMDEQRFQDMKRGMNQFTKGVTQMKKFVEQTQRKLSASGVGMPAELTNALAKAPELLAKLKAAKTADEFDELMGDMQDIGMTMQEWGPKLGDLQRLAGMIKNLDKDVKNMRTNFTRVQKAAKKRPELAEPLADLQQKFDDMAKRAADVKVLAKTDPEGALDLIDDFYGNSEEFWNQISFLDMVSNMAKGLTQANSQIRLLESKIRSMEKAKGADKEAIAALKELVTAVKAALPELKAAMAVRPIDYETVRDLAENFWMQLQDLQNQMADQGQSFYAPTVQPGQGININIPEGFLGGGPGASQFDSSPAATGF